jgi:hypothetical protein
MILILLLGNLLFSTIMPFWGSTKENLKIYFIKVDITSLECEILESGLFMFHWKIKFTEKYSGIPYISECDYPVRFASCKHKRINSEYYKITMQIFYNKTTNAIEYCIAYWSFSLKKIKIYEK